MPKICQLFPAPAPSSTSRGRVREKREKLQIGFLIIYSASTHRTIFTLLKHAAIMIIDFFLMSFNFLFEANQNQVVIWKVNLFLIYSKGASHFFQCSSSSEAPTVKIYSTELIIYLHQNLAVNRNKNEIENVERCGEAVSWSALKTQMTKFLPLVANSKSIMNYVRQITVDILYDSKDSKVK